MVSFEDFTYPIPLKIQVVPYSVLSGQVNMSLDHFLAMKCDENSDPIFRFYGWKPYSISLGKHQKEDIINKELLSKSGYDLVQRPTGGRAIFHANELTYSVIFPKHRILHKQLYEFIHLVITRSLNKLGYEVSMDSGTSVLPIIKQKAEDFPCFTRSAKTEIQFEGKKLVGSAQRLYKKSILQHGSILIGKEHENLSDFLKETQEQREIIRNEIIKKTVCLNSIKKISITPRKIMRAVINQLELIKDISVYFKSINDILNDEYFASELI